MIQIAASWHHSCSIGVQQQKHSKQETTMKTIKAIFMAMVMTMVLVPCVSAATFIPANNAEGAYCVANAAFSGTGAPAIATETAGSSYRCVSTPAYTDYTNVRPVGCPANADYPETPAVMGAW
jgi:hypothetical protein